MKTADCGESRSAKREHDSNWSVLRMVGVLRATLSCGWQDDHAVLHISTSRGALWPALTTEKGSTYPQHRLASSWVCSSGSMNRSGAREVQTSKRESVVENLHPNIHFHPLPRTLLLAEKRQAIDDAPRYMSDSDASVYSSDDETGRLGRNLPRHRYPTVDDEQDNGPIDRDEALYGVFMDHPKTRRPRTSTAPMFVKGDIQEGAEETPDEVPSEPRPPSPASIQRTQIREEANERFYALLKEGSSKRRKLDHLRDDDPAGTAGLGAPSSQSAPGQQSAPHAAATPGFHRNLFKPKAARDPKLGMFEKHTKGFGSKMLAKMGYAGSGGLGEKGISRPIEVKVRPTNLGLGFGRFKEASQLVANRRIEAEVRGEALPEEKPQPSASTIAVPSTFGTTQDLLKEESWLKGEKKKKAARNVVQYTDLLKKEKPMVVIDMRGPAKDDVGPPGPPPLAEELLHNLSTLLQTHESRVYSLAELVKSSEARLENLQRERTASEQRQREQSIRVAKLEQLSQILDDVRQVEKNGSPSVEQEDMFLSALRKLSDLFDSNERSSLKLIDVLIPSICESFVDAKLSSWRPIRDDSELTLSLLNSIANVAAAASESIDERCSVFRHLLQSSVLPRLQKLLESSKWDPVTEPMVVLALYQSLVEMVTNPSFEQASGATDSTVDVLPSGADLLENSQSFKAIIQRDLVDSTIMTKLQRAIDDWKPKLDRRGQLRDPPDVWLLPWVPILLRSPMMSSLVSSLKGKLKSAVSYLDKEARNGLAFLREANSFLRPWTALLKKDTIIHLASRYICPRFAKYLAKLEISSDPKDQEWRGIDLLWTMCSNGLLRAIDVLSLVEGELLPSWARICHSLLLNGEGTEKCVSLFLVWKTYFLVVSPTKTLANDEAICRCFYTVLVMIRDAKDSTQTESLYPTIPGYRAVLSRRSATLRREAKDDLLRMEHADPLEAEARIRLDQSGSTMPTFRDVVEDFAKDRGILFRPRLGVNALKDGKQVFLFGDVPVYLESQVVYVQHAAEWVPMSLERLAQLASVADS